MFSYLRDKYLDRWIAGYLKQRLSRSLVLPVSGPRHLLFALCDHYEPLFGGVDEQTGDRRVKSWQELYPRLASEFRDADGRPPRYSFFFPGEEYRPIFMERLADLARQGLGEVELHLHHDDDTADGLRSDIRRYLKLFAEHGHISRAADGKFRFAFIHGNWCLANGREDGKMCGVDAELPLLFEEGCYCDLTFPAAPDECQPNIVNQIYWPTGDIARRRAYEHGERAAVGARYDDRLLIIQGPLCLAIKPARMPLRIENGHLTDVDPPTPRRVDDWVEQHIHIKGRPEWVFVKVHTHAAPEGSAASLLGDGGRALHRALARYNDGERWKLHYVTAREMYNIAIAAIDGKMGNPCDYRDYCIAPPPIAAG